MAKKKIVKKVPKETQKKVQKNTQKKAIKTEVRSKKQNDVQQFETKLLEMATTFENFAKLNKLFLKNCNSSFKKYNDIAKEYKQVKTNLSIEKKKYGRLSSIAKIAIKQNQKLRNTVSNAIKIISLKNGVIKRLKQKTAEPVYKRNIANTNRIAI